MTEYITISEPIKGIVSAPQSSIEHRDDILATAKCIVQVTSQDELELAVAALKELTTITKETESARKTIKAPIIALGKQIETVAEAFVAPVEKEKLRITGIVNHWQREQLRIKEEADRKAEQAKKDAEKAAADAAKAIESAKTPDELLAAQLAQEEAEMSKQSAETTLAAPTNTPKGLVTKTRYDFEITSPMHLVRECPANWIWHKETETLKFDRAGFLKALNSETVPHKLLPDETQQSVTHSALGLRVYRDVSSHVRG